MRQDRKKNLESRGDGMRAGETDRVREREMERQAREEEREERKEDRHGGEE